MFFIYIILFSFSVTVRNAAGAWKFDLNPGSVVGLFCMLLFALCTLK